jgi:hypothetical protein
MDIRPPALNSQDPFFIGHFVAASSRQMRTLVRNAPLFIYAVSRGIRAQKIFPSLVNVSQPITMGGWEIRDRGHFYALISLAMRRVLVDLARKRLAVRRGGGEAMLSLEESGALLQTSVHDAEQIVEIGTLMERLEAEDPDAARMVDMHYFSGFTIEEIAQEIGLTLKQGNACAKSAI